MVGVGINLHTCVTYFSMLTSLDGYVADNAGNFQWAAPNEEVHAFIDDLERNTGTFLLGQLLVAEGYTHKTKTS
jgi:hypothetical protein